MRLCQLLPALLVLSTLMACEPVTEPDNTEQNERDRDGTTLTPPDQSENSVDLDLTQRIRSAIMDAEGLSFNAQNIKIVTVSGKVTLRGPVESIDERDRVLNLAKSIAGDGNVDDQLEVK